MKRILLLTIAFATATTLSAQKFGFVDSDYIRSNIPAFTAAQEQLNALAEQWEKEVTEGYAEVEKMYREYQNEAVMLTQEMRVQREEAIIAREREVKELQERYFGVEGELFLKRQELIQPIQDQILDAIKEVADEGGFAAIFDTSSGGNILFANARHDVSDIVLEKLGYGK